MCLECCWDERQAVPVAEVGLRLSSAGPHTAQHDSFGLVLLDKTFARM